jgi:hypothetical protein
VFGAVRRLFGVNLYFILFGKNKIYILVQKNVFGFFGVEKNWSVLYTTTDINHVNPIV